MRILFTTWAWPSHLYAMVPLAWALRAAGHDVRVATQPALLPAVAATGLPGVPVGRDVDAAGMVRGYVLAAAAAAAGTGGQAPAGSRGGPRAVRMFLELADAMVDDLVAVTRQWRPDVLVSEPTAWAGPVAAAATGTPLVRQTYGSDLVHRARGLAAEALEPLCARHGVERLDLQGLATVDVCPPQLQVRTDHPGLPMRYVPFNGPGAVPAAGPPPSGRPRVCVTWGTTLSRLGPPFFLAGEVARALAPTGAELVVAVTGEQRSLLGPLPEGVRVVTGAPLHLLLPGCDLVVTHGGAGTILTSLAAGLPLLLVPQLPDHAAHAGHVVAAGAGEVLLREEATPEALRQEVAGLLAGPQRAVAGRLAAEMAARPAPAAVAAQLAARIGGDGAA